MSDPARSTPVSVITSSWGTTELSSLARDAFTLDTQDLRGTNLTEILRRCARIFSSCDGSAGSYELSASVGSLDYFISHNWSVGRRDKYLSLALHFNFSAALAVTCLTSAVCLIANVSGLFPLFLIRNVSSFVDCPIGLSGTILLCPVFLIILLFKQDISPCIGGPRCFLDKTCIHQTDPQLRRKGIGKLGAFFSQSSNFLVLYTDMYLKKLWTVYEVACFITSEKSVNIQILHVCFAKYFFIAMICLYISTILQATLAPFSAFLGRSLTILKHLLLAFAWTVVTRHTHRSFTTTWENIKVFKVQNALCLKEDDRPRVEKIITALMICQQITTAHDGHIDALDAFNNLVRRQVLETMKIATGGSPMPLIWIVSILGVSLYGHNLDIVSGIMKDSGVAHRKPWCYFLHITTWSFGVIPLIALMLNSAMSFKMHLRGYKEWGWIVFAFCINIVGGYLFEMVNHFLNERSLEDARFLILLVPYNMLFLISIGLVWLKLKKRKRSILSTLDHEMADERIKRISETISETGNLEAIGCPVEQIECVVESSEAFAARGSETMRMSHKISL